MYDSIYSGFAKTYSCNMSFMLNPEAYSILESSILLQINEGAGAWIKQVTGNIFEYSDPVKLSFNIASVPKQLRVESNLILNEDDVSRAHNICRGWQPEKWSLIEAVRILFNLTVIHKTDNAEDILFQIYQLTELNEQAAFKRNSSVRENRVFPKLLERGCSL